MTIAPRLFTCLGPILFLLGCGAPSYLASHRPDVLRSLQEHPDSTPAISPRSNQSITIRFVGDSSAYPSGGHQDPANSEISNLSRTLLVPQHGLVLFSSICDALATRGFQVRRLPLPDLELIPSGVASRRLDIFIERIELDTWPLQDNDTAAQLGMRAAISWTLRDEHDVSLRTRSDSTAIKVAPGTDPFAAAAQNIAKSITASTLDVFQ